MTKPLLGIAVVLPLFLAIGACSSSDDPNPTPDGPCTPDAASIERDVFATSCLDAGCHNATDLAGDLDLGGPGAAEALIRKAASTCQRTLVLPGDPSSSFLYEKVSADQPECGTPMPVGASLDAERLACIRDWIGGLQDTCETCGGATCIDTATDPAHCGGCDSSCPADATCEGGSCICSGGQDLCGGACVDTMSDPSHCGGCDAPCNGMLVCSLGSCKAGCDGSLTACDGACVDTTGDPEHCGDCTTVCGDAEICLDSMCACPGGADTMTDPDNCGSCGHQCGPGQTCAGGQCTCGSTSVSFAADIQPIFDGHCNSNACHGGVVPAGMLNLKSGAAYGSIVGVPSGQCASRLIVAPGETANSYILNKVLGVDLCFGSKMPKTGSIASSDVLALSSWICNGALDN